MGEKIEGIDQLLLKSIESSEIQRLISKNGQLIVIDFKKEEADFGPPIEIRLSKHQAINLFENKDFEVIGSYDLKYHYLLIFQKK